MPHDFVPLRDQAPLMIRKPSSVSRTGESLENQHRCRGGLAPRRHWLAAVLRSFSGFLMTALIALALFGVLYFYSEILLIMTSATKKEFNALVTGLSIALGLSVTLGFSSMISTLRWWILGRKHHSLPKIDLIIQMDSIVQLVSLGCKTRSIGTHLTILIWVVVITVGVWHAASCPCTNGTSTVMRTDRTTSSARERRLLSPPWDLPMVWKLPRQGPWS